MAGEEETSLDKGCCDEVSCDSGNGCNSIVVELPRQHGKTSLAIMSALTALKDGKSVLYVTKTHADASHVSQRIIELLSFEKWVCVAMQVSDADWRRHVEDWRVS